MSVWYHKDHSRIELNADGEFVCKDLDIKASSLAACKKKIDEQSTNGTRLPRTAVLYKGSYSNFGAMSEVTVTSVVDESLHYQKVRGTDRSGTSSIYGTTALYPNDPAKAARVAEKQKELYDAKKAFEERQAEELKAFIEEVDFKPFETVAKLRAYCEAQNAKQEG